MLWRLSYNTKKNIWLVGRVFLAKLKTYYNRPGISERKKCQSTEEWK